MNAHFKLLSVIGLVVLAISLAFAFRAYLTPSMLMEFINVTFCSG